MILMALIFVIQCVMTVLYALAVYQAAVMYGGGEALFVAVFGFYAICTICYAILMWKE